MTSRIKDLSGMEFGRLLVLRLDRIDEKQNARWLCRCECGETKSIRGFQLTGGGSRSCGCIQKEIAADMHRTHGQTGSPEYHAWDAMIARCTNSNHPSYKNYGGRGISVCEEWLGSFETFFADMGERPSSKHSIERSNNELGYSKQNCVWATRREQSRNHRRNRYIETPMGTMLLCDAVEKSGINMVTLRSRLRRGWPPERLFDLLRVNGSGRLR